MSAAINPPVAPRGKAPARPDTSIDKLSPEARKKALNSTVRSACVCKPKSYKLATANAVNFAFASTGVRLSARNWHFATAAAEEMFIATASADDVIAYASAIAIGADNEVKPEEAEKFAANQNSLKGLMSKIWKKLKANGSAIGSVAAIAGSIALVASALTLIVKNPAKFGGISKKFAENAQVWAEKIGQLSAKVIQEAKKKPGLVKEFLLKRLEKGAALLQANGARLMAAAEKEVEHAGKVAKTGTKQLARKAGRGLSDLGSRVANKAAAPFEQLA